MRRVGMASVVLVALVAVGQAQMPPNAGGFTGKYAEADHPAAKAVAEAFASGKLFEPAMHYLQAKGTDEEKAQARKRLADSLVKVKKMFAKDAKLTYVAGMAWTFSAKKEGNQMVPAKLKNETLEYPSTFVLPGDHLRQVYLLYRTEGANGEKMFVHFLMWPEGDRWLVGSMYISNATIRKLDFAQTLAAAQKADKAGQKVLALGLYYRAMLLVNGPGYRTSGQQGRMKGVLREVSTRYDLGTKPVVTVTTADGQTDVMAVGSVIIGGDTYVTVISTVEKLLGNDKAQKARERLIAEAVFRKLPELKEYFDGVAVNEIVRGTQSGYRSVYLFDDLAGKPDDKADRPGAGSDAGPVEHVTK